MRLRIWLSVCLILFLMLGLSNLNHGFATVTGTFHFRGYFDGSDYIYIRNAGGEVWYEHIKYDYPGLHSPYNSSSPAPTTIDGVDWHPSWNYTSQLSDTYVTNSPQNYPSGEWVAINITKITSQSDPEQSRGPVTIEDFPSNSNNYTAKILVNDDTGSIVFFGAAWYEFELSWEASSLVPEYPYGIIGVLFAPVPITIVILSKYKHRHIRATTTAYFSKVY